jgi:hypothetical protein
MADILPFSANITEETLIASTRLLVHAPCFMLANFLLIHGRHNRLPPDTPFPQIDVLSDGFKELCAIIAKYNAQSHFRLRLLHRHMTIPEGHILLGSSITGGYWTTPTRISDIDLRKIYPHIISVDAASYTTEGEKRNLYPSEFREGAPGSVRNIDGNFITEFTDCLWRKSLENTLGLEAIQGQAGKMIEFSFNVGSLLLKEQEVRAEVRGEGKGQFTFQVTGWAITIENGAVKHTGEIQCVKLEDEHRPIPVPDEVTKVSDIVKILRDQGILAMQGT